MFDVVVIGSGPGGYVAAIRAAQLGLKTACVEKNPKLGGTCLNVGCIPSKALLHSSEEYWKLSKHGSTLGIEASDLRFDFSKMMERKDKIVFGFNQGIEGLFKKNKIERFTGQACFIGQDRIRVADKEIAGKNFIIATGSEPIPLAFLPFDEERVLSSTGALALKSVPKKMVVVGAGVIGVELGSVYNRLGTEVIFVEFMERICPTFDDSLSKALQQSLTKQGMSFQLRAKVVSGSVSEKGVSLTVEQEGKKSEIDAEVALVCIGRRAYSSGLELNRAGVQLTEKGLIAIDGQFRTSAPHIYAIGDVVDGPMLAHKASEEAVAVAEIIAGEHPRVDYMAIPNVIYTLPEVASVGFSESEAKKLGIQVKSGQFPFKANSRARCTDAEEGFVKILADEKTGRIIGVHIIGAHASELIAEAGLGIAKRATVHDIAHMPHAHPTLSEAIKEAALAVLGRALHIPVPVERQSQAK